MTRSRPTPGRSPRGRRVDQALRAELARALPGLADPRLEMVSITDVRATHDLREAVVHVSVLGDEARRARALAGLESARGFLQGRVATLGYKHTPQLRFAYDTALEQGLRINEILAAEEQRAAGGDR